MSYQMSPKDYKKNNNCIDIYIFFGPIINEGQIRSIVGYLLRFTNREFVR